MSPAKKPPRPVTAWFLVWGDGKLASPATNERRTGHVRCRVTPIRPATDAEIEKLARRLWEAASPSPYGVTSWDCLGVGEVLWLKEIARAAWKRGAR